MLSAGLCYIVISSRRVILLNDIRRHRLRISPPVQRRAQLSAVNEPPERPSIKIDGPGNEGGATVVKG